MRVIKDNLRLPKPALQAIAVVGWATVLYLAWVVGSDSWNRTMFSLQALGGEMPDLGPFQQRYIDHPIMTMFHTVPGVLFAILGPMQFMAPIRRRIPRVHRMSGRVFLVIAMSSGIGAILMTFRLPMWGMTFNQVVGFVFGAFMLFAFSKAFLHVRARRFPIHREWMIRGFAAGLGVAFFRVLLEEVLPSMGYDFTPAWNTAMVACFPVTLVIAEFWIWATRKKTSVTVSTPDMSPAGA